MDASEIRGAAPLTAGLVYSSVEDGRFVYRLLEPPAGRARMVATLQAIYDAHKGAVGNGPMSVVLLRRVADVAPSITGTGPPGQDILAMAVSGPEGHEAVVRGGEDAPLQPARLRW
jgi:hypothetical protein